MCDYAGKLIAWLDHELPDEEATNVEWHVRQCAECRKAVSAYEDVSRAFLACYEATMVVRREPAGSRWFVIASGVAAAILLASVLPPPRLEQLPPRTLVVHAPAIALEKAPASEETSHSEQPAATIAAVHRRSRPTPLPAAAPIPLHWIPMERTVEVALPADALFPPGAVPPGFSFIADIRP